MNSHDSGQRQHHAESGHVNPWKCSSSNDQVRRFQGKQLEHIKMLIRVNKLFAYAAYCTERVWQPLLAQVRLSQAVPTTTRGWLAATFENVSNRIGNTCKKIHLCRSGNRMYPPKYGPHATMVVSIGQKL